ncbi:MAG: hypothetical protein RI909_250 [Bacteroidota bacterium]
MTHRSHLCNLKATESGFLWTEGGYNRLRRVFEFSHSAKAASVRSL